MTNFKTNEQIDSENKIWIWVLGVVVGLMIGMFIAGMFLTDSKQTELQQLLLEETKKVDVEGWNCYDYSKYYNETLSENYLELDIRWLRYVDIGNEYYYHTFLVVGGYGGECILDQHQVSCVEIE